MGFRDELEAWSQAIESFDHGEYREALHMFEAIRPMTSKMHFNAAACYVELGEFEHAARLFDVSLELDPFLTLAYFWSGICEFKLINYEAALLKFNSTLLYLRGNAVVDYSQLGLEFCLYACEVLCNRGISSLHLGNTIGGLEDLQFASKEKQQKRHNVIDTLLHDVTAMCEGGEGGDVYPTTLFEVPARSVFRPSKQKTQNLMPKNYLGTSQVVAAGGSENEVGFPGLDRLDIQDLKSRQSVDESVGKSYAATHLVRSLPPIQITANMSPSEANSQSSPIGSPYSSTGHRSPSPRFPLSPILRPFSPKVKPLSPRMRPYSPGVKPLSPRVSTTHYSNAPLQDEDFSFYPLYNHGSPVRTSMGSVRSSAERKLKVKARYQDDVRVLVVPLDIAFDDLSRLITDKMGILLATGLRYFVRDEENDMVVMMEEEDLRMAIDARMMHSNASEYIQLDVYVR